MDEILGKHFHCPRPLLIHYNFQYFPSVSASPMQKNADKAAGSLACSVWAWSRCKASCNRRPNARLADRTPRAFPGEDWSDWEGAAGGFC